MALTSRALAFGLLLLAASAPGARAHTPYLLPNSFDPERDHLTLQGALTEDDYFHPDIALKAPAYVETTPSGGRQEVAPAAVLKDLAVVEAPLPESGTYRFSTGAWVGRRMKMAKLGDRWLMVRPADGPNGDHGGGHAPGPGAPGGGRPEHGDGPPSITQAALPAGAPVVEVSNVMTAETYVSKGAPTEAALKTSGQGFELKPLTHPNSVYVDQGFAFQFLIDGQPAAGVPVTAYREGDVYDDRKIAAEARTDAAGKARLGFERPGVYLLTAHYPAGERKPGDAPVAHNYVYSLTFEVTR